MLAVGAGVKEKLIERGEKEVYRVVGATSGGDA